MLSSENVLPGCLSVTFNPSLEPQLGQPIMTGKGIRNRQKDTTFAGNDEVVSFDKKYFLESQIDRSKQIERR